MSSGGTDGKTGLLLSDFPVGIGKGRKCPAGCGEAQGADFSQLRVPVVEAGYNSEGRIHP